MGRTNNTNRITQKTRRTPRRNRHLEKQQLLFGFVYDFLKDSPRSYRHGTVNDFHWGFKPTLGNLIIIIQHLLDKNIHI